MKTVFIIIIVIVVIIWLHFNPYANRVRKIQKLLNFDRTVTDAINMLPNWEVSPFDKKGVRIAIVPQFIVAPYYLYITYKGDMPSGKELKMLIEELTSENSIVTKAHKLNMPVEQYIAVNSK